jgi:tetratricopeptide (TPR) repeat protein
MSKRKAKNRPLNSSPLGDALGICSVPPAGPAIAPFDPPSPSKQVMLSTGSQYAPLGRVCPAIAVNDRHKQSITLAQKNVILFIGSTLHNDVSAKRLIRAAQVAYDTRQLDTLTLISQALTNHANYKPIAAYYLGLAQQNLGKGNLERAEKLFEYAADYAPARYKAKALLALGAVSGYQGKIATELDFYSQTLKIAEADYWTRIETNRAVAFNYNLAGDYHAAIALLEQIAPMVRAIARINPRLYFDYINNYAVNLHAVGRLHEAARLSALACASPLAVVYHEWTETRDDVAADLAEQEQRQLIVAAPQVQAEEGREEKQARVTYAKHKLAASLITVISEPYHLLSRTVDTIITIQSRVYRRAPIHAPPSAFRK